MSKHEKKDWSQFKQKHEGQADEEQEPFEEETGPEEASEPPRTESLEHPDLNEQLALAEKQAHENWEKSVRAMAELDNVRRRAEREIANAHRYGVEKLITSLLPVMDSLEQALQLAVKEKDSAMQEGLELTVKLFIDALEKFDVKQLDPAGAAFDPQEHEAMAIQEAPGTPPNTIMEVFQKGYKLNDRVIRPARVIVSKK